MALRGCGPTFWDYLHRSGGSLDHPALRRERRAARRGHDLLVGHAGFTPSNLSALSSRLDNHVDKLYGHSLPANFLSETNSDRYILYDGATGIELQLHRRPVHRPLLMTYPDGSWRHAAIAGPVSFTLMTRSEQ